MKVQLPVSTPEISSEVCLKRICLCLIFTCLSTSWLQALFMLFKKKSLKRFWHHHSCEVRNVDPSNKKKTKKKEICQIKQRYFCRHVFKIDYLRCKSASHGLNVWPVKTHGFFALQGQLTSYFLADFLPLVDSFSDLRWVKNLTNQCASTWKDQKALRIFHNWPLAVLLKIN